MKKININFVAILICATMMLSNGYTQSYNDDSRENLLSNFVNLTEDFFGQIEDSVSRDSNSDVRDFYFDFFENEGTRDEKTFDEETETWDYEYVPRLVTINTNNAVGEIPITSSVTQMGAVTYTVPIEVYPGINGMQPELAVVYNSMAGNGFMGVGWNVAGLSSITRGNKSIYYDNTVEGVRMNKDAAFYLDGMRLIKLSETSNQIKYETEQGKILVTAHIYTLGQILKHISHFEVFYPNGNSAIYGFSDNRIDRLEYPLTELTDLYDNKMEFEYVNSSDPYRIDKIKYSNSTVEFSYSGRNDKLTYYSGGRQIAINHLLTGIICKFGSTTIRNYDFSYDDTNTQNVSLLETLTMSAGGTSFPPLEFSYGEGSISTAYSKETITVLGGWSINNPSDVGITKGKFDNNTDDDALIVWRKRDPYYASGYLINEPIFLYTKLSTVPLTLELTTEKGFVDIFCANIDGMGNEEVIKVNNKATHTADPPFGYKDHIIFEVYKANATTQLLLYKTLEFYFPTVHGESFKYPQPKVFLAGDFLGNGKTQILVVSGHNSHGTDLPTNVYLFDLEKNGEAALIHHEETPFQFNMQWYSSLTQHDFLYVIDYDGDGKADICHVNSTGAHIYTFDVNYKTTSFGSFISTSWKHVNSFESDILRRVNSLGYVYNYRLVMPGDFNGDGKTDLLVSPRYLEGSHVTVDDDWYIYFSKGNGEFEQKKLPTGHHRLQNYMYCLQDVNSDGMVDLLEYTLGNFVTYLSTGDGFSQAGSGTTFSPSNPVLVPTNLNSRNYFNQVIALKDNKIALYSFKRNDAMEKMLTEVHNGLGVVEKNEYQMLNKLGKYPYSVYFPGTGATYPYENSKGTGFVVTQLREQYLNSNLTAQIQYSYENAVVHKQGLGFKGFEKIKEYDNIRKRENYSKWDPFNYGLLMEENSFAANIQYEYEKPSTVPSTEKRFRWRLKEKIMEDKLKNTTTTVTYSNFDSYDFAQNEEIDYGEGNNDKNYYTYYHNSSTPGYLLGFLTKRIKIIDHNNDKLVEYYKVLDHSNGKPEEIQYTVSKLIPVNPKDLNASDDRKISYEKFTYYPNGTVNTYTTKAYVSDNGFTTTYVYDNYGRIEKKTNPMDFETNYYYTGANLTSMVDHLGLTTSFGHDAFGRVTTTTYPDGTESATDYLWEAEGTNGLYCIQRTATGKPWAKTYFDGLGRETASRVQNFDNTYSTTHKTYDGRGRLQYVSLPFLQSSSKWNEYKYYTNDRLQSYDEASGRKTSYSYSGKNVTIIKDGISSTYKYNTKGNLVEVDDPAGTITYNLRADGQPKTIVAPGNVTTTFEYDDYCRRTKLIDPSAGTQTWTYDKEGNVEWETDALANTIFYGYDKYNRIVKVNRPEFNTEYVYDSDGFLESISSTNNTATSFEYDAYGRLDKETENVPNGYWLKKTYSYSGGNVSSTNYTSNNGNIVTENYSYQNGHLKEIKLNNTTSIWQLDQINEFGQPTKVYTGNIERFYDFDDYGFPESRIARTSVNNVFQSQSYEFDHTTGNLNFRKDNIRNITERFDYDGLNRMTDYAGQTATYDAKGNITKKTDIGSSFKYSLVAKPYAISNVSSPTDAISHATQTVTYNSFKRPQTIVEGDYSASFTYNSNGNRVKMSSNYANDLTYISNCYEISENIITPKLNTYRLYLGGDYYTAPAVYVKGIGGTWQLYYIVRDYLGSITHIANATGNLIEENSYDAWGRLRNPANYNEVYSAENQPSLFLGRGYTGHEHLPWYGLINMNARLYDPAVGRFLSPDPYVPNVTNSQDFNRYSYARNNPMVYTDPSGEVVWFVPVIVGAVIGATSGAMIGQANGATGMNMAGYIAGGAIIGGLSGGAAAGVSAIGGAAWWAGAAAGAVGGAGFSGLATNWDGGAMVKGAVFGAISGFVGGGVGSAIGGGWGALAGGASSNLTSQLLYNEGDFSDVDWASVGISGAASWGMYHGMSYASWKWGGGNRLGVSMRYSAYCKMNAQMQRSRFWRRESGGYLMKNGSYVAVKNKYTSKYHVDWDGANSQLSSKQMKNVGIRVHTHWDTDRITYYYNGNKISSDEAFVYMALGGTVTQQQTYLGFSPDDLSLYGNQILLNRVGGAFYSNWGYNPKMFDLPDVFLRFFLFPF